MFNLVRRYVAQGGTPEQLRQEGQSANYVLGKGHVRFFYDKLLWLSWRHIYLVNEMVKRGYDPQFFENLRVTFRDIPTEWWNDWEPDTRARLINRERIHDRLNGVKS